MQLPIPQQSAEPDQPQSQGIHAMLLRFAYTGRRKFASIAAGFLVLVVGYHVVFGANGLTAFEAKRLQNKALAQQIEVLKQENEHLADQNARLSTDKRAIEDSIRANLHFTKPNEVVLTVQDAPAATPAK